MDNLSLFKDRVLDKINHIPNGWKIRKLKYLLKDNITDGPHTTPTFVFEGVPFLSVDNIVDGEIDFENCRYISEKDYKIFSKKCSIDTNDILFGKAASTGKIARVKDKRKFTVWSPLALLKVNEKIILPEYLEFFLKSSISQYQIEILCNSNTQKNISMDDMPFIEIIYPKDIKEQKKITDILVNNKQQVSESINKLNIINSLLLEKKKSMINKTILGGFYKYKKKYNSNVEWIGTIPNNYKLLPLKYICEIKRGSFSHRPRNDERLYDGDYPFIQTGDVAKAGKYLTKYSQSLNKWGFSVSTEFPVNTILMTIAANIGDISILKIKSCFPDSIIGFQPNNKIITYEYLYFLLYSLKDELIKLSTINTQKNLNAERVGSIKVPICDIDIQKKMILFLNKNFTKIDKKIEINRKRISLLNEFIFSLISNYVLGTNIIK